MKDAHSSPEQAKFETLAQLAALCAQKGMQQIIISPGSRSAPLTVAFNRQPDLTCRVVMDERAAAFIALGMAQQTGRPVGLVCTSGTAALNYAPAVTEAFYQKIPLLLFTADRPPEWIDQQDGQTIHQPHLYGDHCRAYFQLPVDYRHPDARWQATRTLSEAIEQAQWPTPGPVQINAPLREPLYPAPGHHISVTPPRSIERISGEPTLTQENWDKLRAAWQQASKKLIIAGMQPPDPVLSAALVELQQDPTVAIIADITANLQPSGTRLYHADMILSTKVAAALETLRPELVVSFGGPVVSKSLKLFLRKHHPQAHWHIQVDGQFIDTFQALTQVIAVQPRYFFETLLGQGPPGPPQGGDFSARPSQRGDLSARPSQGGDFSARPSQGGDFSAGFPQEGEKTNIPPTGSGGPKPTDTYFNTWLALEKEAHHRLAEFLADRPSNNFNNFNEFYAVQQVMRALPAGSRLQLGNSMPVRYANYIGLGGLGPDVGAGVVRVNANRGTSGIDGSLSTTVGAALATDALTTLITGDLAFFYDRNGLWHQHVPPNLRIVILNNGGGGIFKLIDGPSNLPAAELEEYFFTPQPLTAKHTAADHNCAYFQAATAAELQRQLPEFFAPRPQAAILEIETDSDINTQIFRDFKASMALLGG